MTENSKRLDGDTETNTPDYMDMVTTHMLHRIWELQIVQCLLLAETDEDREYVQSVVDRQVEGDYINDLRW